MMTDRNYAALAVVCLISVLASWAPALWLKREIPKPVKPDAKRVENDIDYDEDLDHDFGHPYPYYPMPPGKGKNKERIKSEIIDGAYRRLHRRYNARLYIWEEFDPSIGIHTSEDGEVIFNVIYQHHGTQTNREFDRLVEVRSESLRGILKRRLRSVDATLDYRAQVDTILDQKPEVQIPLVYH